ncbi:heavy metal translocating P-type ATPase [Brevundimonas sp.]|uniref:heavy metal translocating P-type ATPase n=1 Tax=Brevundimonas sp. TaxID=1871086 RepID=UPI002D2C62E7|nr:heavy metal translocating P-type ATPase [Brevundimonas sp.]HYD27037.1 heavy metal translocating P-type ATPase [Brevundimonas sp.]
MAVTFDAALQPDMSAFLRKRDDGRASLDLLVTGARCAGCISKIEREVSRLPGVEAARLNLSTGRLSVGLTDGDMDPAAIISALDRLGYPATPFDPGAALVQRDREGRRLILALAVAGFGAMNAMMFSVPIWAGLFDQELGPATRTMMMWMSAAVGAPCAVFAGMPFFQSAWRSLRSGRANMDVPISVGVILTLAISFSETILNGRDAYFDAAVSLLFLLLIGRWLDHVLRARARSAAGDLLALQAPAACVVDGSGHERSIPLGDVRPGDILRVRPGDRIPVDATLEEGEALIDNSLLTGESAPERVGPGQLCRAGAVNTTGLLTLRASARSEDSTLAAIARLVEAGAQSRSRYVRLADRAAALYVPVVHAAALATFAGGWALGLDPREALIRAVAVLIVTCPCALGLAVPAVQIVASARLFRRGVLVKSGAALERLAEIDHVVFDKTGVLTEGRPALVGAPQEVIAMAAPLARASSHPMARAIARAAGDGPVAANVVEHAGLGVEGVIDGRRARLGRAAFVGVPTLRSGETELWFGFEDSEKTRLQFSDVVRPDAAAAVEALKARGVTAEIMSGDQVGAVRTVAETVGLATWKAGMLPEEKSEAIDHLTAAGRKVLMVGDGLNDAAALARAHAAIAPGSALEASQNAADLVLTNDALMAVVEAIDTARSARRRALENFGFAALYNLVAAPAAMLGFVNPFVAALAMSGSSLVVTLNALRVRSGR